MQEPKKLFSIRIVVSDFYMSRPIPGLDPTYSEFRGHEIKSLPVVRIFGSTTNGEKTCMHVHGVFPYFYVPYDEGIASDSDQVACQIADSLDKAINISLGQTQSSNQHVFKIQLVKGVPFYGYHQKDHQFLKIFLYNPRFIKKAANLLQNGAILGRVFQPHESHVPYNLQFCIDYNLYGMSFLHVPIEVIKYRQSDEFEPLVGLSEDQVLESKVTRISTSRHEVDIAAAFILNRFQHLSNKAGNANPGIESIWQDEQMRRKNLADKQDLPPLENPPSQERTWVKPTESEIFFKAALRSKLAVENRENLSGNSSILNKSDAKPDPKKKFNLPKLLTNSVYPSECSQIANSSMANASKISDHLSTNSVFHSSIRDRSKSRSSVSTDKSFVDEDIVLSLSQPRQKSKMNETLVEEDLQVLEIMQQLEEDEGEIDLDSTLAPLTQTKSNMTLKKVGENNSSLKIDDVIDLCSDDEEEEDNLNYTTSVDSVDQILMELTQPKQTKTPQELPQIDGSDDMMSTPKKRRVTRSTAQTKSPRSPRNKIVAKYAPLDITINKSPAAKKQVLENGTPKKSFNETTNSQLFPNISPACVRMKRVALNLNGDLNGLRRNKEMNKDNEKSFIVCSLKPNTPVKNSLAVENVHAKVENYENAVDKLSPSVKKCGIKLKRVCASRICMENEKAKEVPKKVVPLEYGIEASTDVEIEKSTNQDEEIERSIKNETDKPADTASNMPIFENVQIDELTDVGASVIESNKENPTHNDPTKGGDERVVIAKEMEMLIASFNGEKGTEIEIDKIIENLEESVVKGNSNTIEDEINHLQECDVDKSDTIEPNTMNVEVSNEKQNTYEEPNNNVEIKVKHTDEKIPPTEEPNKYISLDANGFVKSNIRAIEVKYETPRRRRSWSPCDIAREFDRAHNYYPKPGTSGIKKNQRKRKKKVDLNPAPQRQTRRTTQLQMSQMSPEKEKICDNEQEEDLNICSFYEKSFLIDSPSLFSDSSPRTPITKPSTESYLDNDCGISSIISENTSAIITLVPKISPPTFAEADVKSIEYDIPEEVFTEPFYGDDTDITSKREVGHTILNIPGRSLNCCKQFESILPNLKGCNTWRKDVLKIMLSDSASNVLQNPASIKECFSNRDHVIISSKIVPPTNSDAKHWLKSLAENHLRNAKPNNNNYEDSPIKIRKERIKMIFGESAYGDENGDSCDLSQRSITLTPLTPESANSKQSDTKSVKNVMITPLNNLAGQTTPLSALQKFRERRKSRARLSLAKKLRRLGSADSASSGTDNVKPGIKNVKTMLMAIKAKVNAIPRSDLTDDAEGLLERSFESQQLSDLCSEKVMQVLERTSFIRNLSIDENCTGSDVSFGISGATPDNTFGFKISLENLQSVKADIERNHLIVFSLEIHANTRGDLKPDPQHDAIECLFYSILHEDLDNTGSNKTTGCIMVILDGLNPYLNGVKTHILPVKTELELFDQLLRLCKKWDPDILCGYEIEMNSWGYLLDRAQTLGMNLKALLSRVPTQKVRETQADEDLDTWIGLDIELKLCGRILLGIWRLMRSEIALTSYTFENVMYHIMHRRCPVHTFPNLTKWYTSPNTRWIVLEYYIERVVGTHELLEQLDLLGRTSEMAKLIGIQFYEVLSRGSQFRVESMMFRIAKPKNLVPVSPSVQQRAHSRAPEYLPLILEPKSRFYADPIIVLDFQSLYPSMIIAYNYCFSTCLGRVEHLGQSSPFEFGSFQLRVPDSVLDWLVDNDHITISPCGVVFVKRYIREGVLPRMLKEILDTRIMVKQSMKIHKANSTLQRVLHSRQLGLKLMANVTYGYTAANFSGRMACVEVADSVVGKGRETLERAIKMVEANEDWRAKVVYGDTDSLFVMVPGRSRAEAFRIGEEIAEAVTNDNPQPVKLKLEKVYQPCILQTKKRYVGYMYESADQKDPVYEAKGIETVRRDGCPAVAKMLEKCLRILFETCDVSQIKRYVCRQFTKLLTGNANVQDLIFAKEFRGRTGYKPGACVPALELTKKWLQSDPRNEPRRGERVPFLIVNGPPGLPLIRLVRSPHDFLADEGLKINAIYYITKAIIPPLNRCLLLIGADVHEWFADLPRKHFTSLAISATNPKNRIYDDSKKSTISQYFASSNCIIDCGRNTKAGICNICIHDKQKCVTKLSHKISKLQRSYILTKQICQSCCGRMENIECASLECPVLFVANQKYRECKQVQHFENIIDDNFTTDSAL